MRALPRLRPLPVAAAALVAVTALLLAPTEALGQYWLHDDGSKTNQSIFRPLPDWPAPNEFRNAAGAMAEVGAPLRLSHGT